MLTLALLLTLTQTTATQTVLAWSATTKEAAASEADKSVFAAGVPLAITEEVVDVSCYTQLGKRGAAQKVCGAKCVLAGMPVRSSIVRRRNFSCGDWISWRIRCPGSGYTM